MVGSRALQGLGLGFPGLLISLIRNIFIATPLAFLFVFVLNYNFLSIAVAVIISSFIAAILAIIFLFNSINKKSKELVETNN